MILRITPGQRQPFFLTRQSFRRARQVVWIDSQTEHLLFEGMIFKRVVSCDVALPGLLNMLGLIIHDVTQG